MYGDKVWSILVAALSKADRSRAILIAATIVAAI
jgi:hypothetical protein